MKRAFLFAALCLTCSLLVAQSVDEIGQGVYAHELEWTPKGGWSLEGQDIHCQHCNIRPVDFECPAALTIEGQVKIEKFDMTQKLQHAMIVFRFQSERRRAYILALSPTTIRLQRNEVGVGRGLRVLASERLSAPLGKWLRFRISAVGGELQADVFLPERITLKVHDPDPIPSGTIGLRSYHTDVTFRSVKISSKPRQESVAHPTETWKFAPRSQWKREGDVLICLRPGSGSLPSTIRAENVKVTGQMRFPPWEPDAVRKEIGVCVRHGYLGGGRTLRYFLAYDGRGFVRLRYSGSSREVIDSVKADLPPNTWIPFSLTCLGDELVGQVGGFTVRGLAKEKFGDEIHLISPCTRGEFKDVKITPYEEIPDEVAQAGVKGAKAPGNGRDDADKPISGWKVVAGTWTKEENGVSSHGGSLQWQGQVQDIIEVEFYLTIRKWTEEGRLHFAGMIWNANSPGNPRNLALIRREKCLSITCQPQRREAPNQRFPCMIPLNTPVRVSARITKRGVQMMVGETEVRKDVPSEDLGDLELHVNGADAVFSEIKVRSLDAPPPTVTQAPPQTPTVKKLVKKRNPVGSSRRFWHREDKAHVFYLIPLSLAQDKFNTWLKETILGDGFTLFLLVAEDTGMKQNYDWSDVDSTVRITVLKNKARGTRHSYGNIAMHGNGRGYLFDLERNLTIERKQYSDKAHDTRIDQIVEVRPLSRVQKEQDHAKRQIEIIERKLRVLRQVQPLFESVSVPTRERNYALVAFKADFDVRNIKSVDFKKQYEEYAPMKELRYYSSLEKDLGIEWPIIKPR